MLATVGVYKMKGGFSLTSYLINLKLMLVLASVEWPLSIFVFREVDGLTFLFSVLYISLFIYIIFQG